MVKLKRLYYGWVMVIIAALILGTHGLVFYTFGVFLRPITMEFGWERGALSTAFSLMTLVSGLLGVIAGRLSDKYGPRPLLTACGILAGVSFILLSQVNSLWQVYLIWGLFIAVSASCCLIPITSTITRWFVKRAGIAIGVAITGLGVGGIVMPLLSQWLIDTYDWRRAYIVLGLMVLIIIVPLAQFMRHSPQRMGLKPYGESETVGENQAQSSTPEGLSFKQAIKTRHFWILSILLFFFMFAAQLILVHIVPHVVDIGISATIAAGVVSILAATSIVGRNLVGFISDKIGARATLSACVITVTLAVVWLFFSGDIWMFYVFAVLLGIAYAGVLPTETLIVRELFGLKFVGMILAGLMLVGTIGGAVGPPLAGYIFDVMGSYSLAFIICIICCVLALVLSLIILFSRGGVVVAKQDVGTL